jgi:hypothetical protein
MVGILRWVMVVMFATACLWLVSHSFHGIDVSWLIAVVEEGSFGGG